MRRQGLEKLQLKRRVARFTAGIRLAGVEEVPCAPVASPLAAFIGGKREILPERLQIGRTEFSPFVFTQRDARLGARLGRTAGLVP